MAPTCNSSPWETEAERLNSSMPCGLQNETLSGREEEKEVLVMNIQKQQCGWGRVARWIKYPHKHTWVQVLVHTCVHTCTQHTYTLQHYKTDFYLRERVACTYQHQLKQKASVVVVRSSAFCF